MPTTVGTTVTDWITAIAAGVSSISGVFIAIVAYVGVSRWLIQIRDKSRFKIAHLLVKNAIIVRETIKFVRNPFPTEAIHNPFPVATSGVQQQSPETDEAIARFVERKNRFRSFEAAYRRLEETMIEAEVLNIEVEAIRPHQLIFLNLGCRIGTALGICEHYYRVKRGRQLDSDESAQLEEAEKTAISHSAPDIPDDVDTLVEKARSDFMSLLKRYLAIDPGGVNRAAWL